MLDLNFSIQGEEQVSRRLDIISEGVSSFKKPLREIGDNFMKVFDLNFASRGSLYGGWAPRKDNNPWPLLEITGKMRYGFTKEYDNTTLKLGNDTDYFVYHQSAQPRSVLPRRVMMKIRSQDATMVVKSFQSYLVQIMRSRTSL